MFKKFDNVPFAERINYNIEWKDGQPVYKTVGENEFISIEQIQFMYPMLTKKEQYTMYIKHNPLNTEKNDYYEYLLYKMNKQDKKDLDEMLKQLSITIKCDNKNFT